MQNEILKPVLETDEVAVPRYDIVNPDGSVIQQNVELRLKNQVMQEGTPYDEESVLPFELATQLGLTATATPAQVLQLLATKSYSKDETLSNETKTLFSLGTDAVPNDVFALTKTLVNNAQNSADSKAKIELGSYIGDGATAEKGKTLTFSFKPKIVFVAGPGDVYEYDYGVAIFIQGAVKARIGLGADDRGTYISGYSYDLTWKNNSVVWKATTNWTGVNCLNGNGNKYYYVGIG